MKKSEKTTVCKMESIGMAFNSRDDFAKSKYDAMLHKRRSLQIKVFTYLDRPSGWKCLLYHIVVFALVLTTLTVSALETVQRVPWISMFLYYLEIILVVIFGTEYFLRIWAAGSHSCYQKVKGRLKYIFRPINIIDLVIVIASVLSLTMGASESMFTATTVKSFRIIQIMRIIRVDRRGSTWSLVSSVIYKHRQELITSLYIGFLLLLVMSYMMFIAENYSKPSEEFRSLADALYWGMMTVTTVGYGDITPVTWVGKTIVACCSVVTIAFFALPAGILATGFALKVQQKQREKQYNRQIPAAAILIQTMWRYKCTNCFTGSNATWAHHALMVLDHRKKAVMNRMSKTTHDNKKNKPQAHKRKTDTNQNQNDGSFSDYENYELTSSQRTQIKVMYRIQYLAAIRKFQQLRNPYDVQDVIEQYSQGHFHLMMRIKELHRKHDQSVGKVNDYGGEKGRPTVMDSLEKLNSKINKMESILINLQAVTLSLAKALNKDDALSLDSESLSSSMLTSGGTNDRNSTDDESTHEAKAVYSTDSESSERLNQAKALFHDRFYLGHQSVVSN